MEDDASIKHLKLDIKVNGTRLTRRSLIHFGTRDGVPIKPIRADTLANLTVKFRQAHLTLDDVAALADGDEVKGVSCNSLGIKKEDAQGVMILQFADATGGSRLPEPAKRAVGHVFSLARKRLEEIARR